jgi:hypothetical protein
MAEYFSKTLERAAEALGVEDVEAVAVIAVDGGVEQVVAAGGYHAQAVFEALAGIEDVLEAADVDEGGVALVFGFGDGVVHVVAELGAGVEQVERGPADAHGGEVVAEVEILMPVERGPVIELLESEAEERVAEEAGDGENLPVIGDMGDEDHYFSVCGLFQYAGLWLRKSSTGTRSPAGSHGGSGSSGSSIRGWRSCTRTSR